MKTKSSRTADNAPISNIVEADLRDRSGELIGVVDELLIDLESGRIEYVLARGLRGERLQYPSTTILRGDKVGILGRNGAGKTTLVKLLLHELAPDAGTVEHGTVVLRRSGPRLVVNESPSR